MSRAVPEWIGKTDDTAIPPRVKLRLFDQQGGKCAKCVRKLGLAGEGVEFDHTIALVNGGENREANIQALCPPCHAPKTKSDVAVKSKTARVKAKNMGIKAPTKHPMPGSRASKFKRTIDGRTVAREG